MQSERLPVWAANKLNPVARVQQLHYFLVSAGVMAVLLVGFFSVSRVLRGHWRVEAWAQSFNRLFAFSLAAPFLVALKQPGVESKRAFHTLFFIGAATACLISGASGSANPGGAGAVHESELSRGLRLVCCRRGA